MKKLRMLIIGIVAMASLGASASPAAAVRVTVSPGQVFSATAPRTLTLSPGRLNIACDLAFGAYFEPGPIYTSLGLSTIFGVTMRAIPGSCSGGATLAFLRPSWPIGFTVATAGVGVPASLRIHIAEFQVTIGALSCLYSGDVHADLNARGTTLTFDAADTIPFYSGGILCPRPVSLAGTMALATPQVFTVV